MRDPTRGGLATTLNEAGARRPGAAVVLDEQTMPVRSRVAAACEILGIDPLYVANEGKLDAVVVAAPRRGEALAPPGRTEARRRRRARRARSCREPAGLVLARDRASEDRRIVDVLVGDPLPRIC